jgi:Putative silver efflux pump
VIDRFVALCLRRRQLVWLIVIVVCTFGYLSWKALAIEAYPDIADVSSQVITQYPGHAAEEVEEQVTVPLERELNGIPGLQVMRSHSTFGLSLITLVFRDGIDDYWARQRIQERIAGVDLPPNANPGLDPLTSPIGEIYRYTLQSTFRDQRELRELQEWVVIPALNKCPELLTLQISEAKRLSSSSLSIRQSSLNTMCPSHRLPPPSKPTMPTPAAVLSIVENRATSCAE